MADETDEEHGYVDPVVKEAARVAELCQTREGRVRRALEAGSYRGVVESLTVDDVAALMPEALAHELAHPELYCLPPDRTADDLVAEAALDARQRSRTSSDPALGPPHWK